MIINISHPFTTPPRETWGILLWLFVWATVVTLLLWNPARRTLKAFEMSTTVNLFPIGTAFISPWLTGEAIPGRDWAGMLIILAGVLLVGFAGRHSPEMVMYEGTQA